MPAPMPAERFIETVKIPVSNPICKGNLSLMKLGINTFPNAIAIPIKAVPNNKKKGVPMERIAIPNASSEIARNNVISIPRRRATLGANGDITAKASNGIVVIKPANTLEISSPSLI